MGEIPPTLDTPYQSSPTSTNPAKLPRRIVVDLTHPLRSCEVPACDGHPKYVAHCLSHVSRGDMSTCHSLTMGTHTGTHIDAPYHFIENGTTVDKLDLSLLTAAPAAVVDLRWKKAREPILWEDLAEYESRLKEGVALLLCTGWSKNWRTPTYTEHPFLHVDAATRILNRGVKVIGMDTMSPDEIGEEGDTGKVHTVWLGAGGIIVENMNGLERLLELGVSRSLRVSLLPLSLVDCDGSPIRAVAWEEPENP